MAKLTNLEDFIENIYDEMPINLSFDSFEKTKEYKIDAFDKIYNYKNFLEKEINFDLFLSKNIINLDGKEIVEISLNTNCPFYNCEIIKKDYFIYIEIDGWDIATYFLKDKEFVSKYETIKDLIELNIDLY